MGLLKQRQVDPLPLWTESGSSAWTDPGCLVPKAGGERDVPPTSSSQAIWFHIKRIPREIRQEKIEKAS